MHASILKQIKTHPTMFALSIGVHLALVVVLVFSLGKQAPPKMPVSKKIDTVKAVIIDARVVEQEKQKLIRAEKKKKDKRFAEKKKLDRDTKKAINKRKKEEKRLADLKRKEKKRQQALVKKEKREHEKKKKEIAKLKKQQKDLEKKHKAEKKKLAAIEKKRKAEEAAVQKKKLAAAAEARRKVQDAEMRLQMQEEERRLAKQSKENQKALAQYVSTIRRHVESKWIAPPSMTAGWSCEIIVEQNRFGEVQKVNTKQCSGSNAFKSTVERAVRKASPLPEAPNNDVFDKKLNFLFRPDV